MNLTTLLSFVESDVRVFGPYKRRGKWLAILVRDDGEEAVDAFAREDLAEKYIRAVQLFLLEEAFERGR